MGLGSSSFPNAERVLSSDVGTAAATAVGMEHWELVWRARLHFERNPGAGEVCEELAGPSAGPTVAASRHNLGEDGMLALATCMSACTGCEGLMCVIEAATFVVTTIIMRTQPVGREYWRRRCMHARCALATTAARAGTPVDSARCSRVK